MTITDMSDDDEHHMSSADPGMLRQVKDFKICQEKLRDTTEKLRDTTEKLDRTTKKLDRITENLESTTEELEIARKKLDKKTKQNAKLQAYIDVTVADQFSKMSKDLKDAWTENESLKRKRVSSQMIPAATRHYLPGIDEF